MKKENHWPIVFIMEAGLYILRQARHIDYQLTTQKGLLVVSDSDFYVGDPISQETHAIIAWRERSMVGCSRVEIRCSTPLHS
jgi:hypothetical protein